MTAREHFRYVLATAENFDESSYLAANPDVRQAVESGFFPSGRRHFDLHGHGEGRQLLQSTLPAWLRRGRVGGWIEARAADVRQRTLVEERLYDLEVQVAQLQHLLHLVHSFGPLPPKHLQVRVVGSYNGDFIRSGFASVVPQLERALSEAGRRLDEFARILDFGCGCGRAIFALHRLFPDAELHGTDIDPEAIEWLTRHWASAAVYTVTPTQPPSAYRDGEFDLVFGISVMTHLPEDLQLAWLGELRRIVRPGGFVVLTVHGEHHYRSALSPEQLAVMDDVGFLYSTSGYGASIALPDFYETAFHSHDYVRRLWGKHFIVRSILPPLPGEHQDTVVLERPV